MNQNYQSQRLFKSEPVALFVQRACKFTLLPIIVLGAILAAPSAATAQTLMMQYGFEDAGTTTADSVAGVSLNIVDSNGNAADLHGAVGTGVGGVGKALDFTSANTANAAGPLASTAANTSIAFGTVSSFTITMWVKPTATPLNFGRYFVLGANGTADSGAANSLSLLNNNALNSVQGGVNTVNPGAITGLTNIIIGQWNFIAATYDGSTYSVYVANETNSVASGGAIANSGGTVNLGTSFSLMLGNRINGRTRGFPAYFDDVRFYTGAADATFLENVRKSVVPDPFVESTLILPSSTPVGGRVIVSAASGGTGLITNQWYFTTAGTTTAIAGATNATYVISGAQVANAGTYTLVVSSSSGVRTNQGAALTVTSLAGASVNIYDLGAADPVPAANDQTQLHSENMATGGNAQDGLNYFADGTAPGQSFTTGSNPNGYIVDGIYVKTAGLNSSGTTTAQTYTLRLYSVSGTTATLLSTYVTANTVAFPDGDWVMYSGGFTNLLQPNKTYAYTHHRNTTGWDLLGYNNNGTDLYPGGNMCVIGASGGAITFGSSGVDDAAFNIGLTPAPTLPVIYQQPASPTVVIGQAASFSVGVLAASPTYQWYTASDTNYSSPRLLSGATSASYSIASPTLSDATNYFVVVTGGSQSVTSSVATLTVRLSVNTVAWLGASSFNWDLTSANWSNTVTFANNFVYQTGDNVQFTDSGKNSSPITLTTVMAPTSVSVTTSSNYTFAGSGLLGGNVQLTKSGTGTLTISNANAFRGATVVNDGTLRMANASALGNATNAVTVNGGTIDFNGTAAPASLRFNIQGTGYTNEGALNNSGGAIQNGNGILGVNLLGDTTIGAVGRWDLNGDGGGTGFQANKHNLTKVGAGTVFLIDAGTNQLSNVTILNGTLGFQGTNDLGDPTKTISVFGGTLAFYAVPNNGMGIDGLGLTKSIVFSNAFFSNAGGSLTLNSPITLLGTNTHSAGYLETSSMQNIFNGPISGTGGWVINSVENDMFYGTNTYSGPTIISTAALLTVGANSSLGNSSAIALNNASAVLDMSQTPGLMLGNGQTLSGSGSIYGNVTNRTGATLAPGVSGPGTLTLSGDVTLAGGTLAIDLGSDPTQQGNNVNDYITVNGNLNLTGVNTIQITPVGPLSTATPYLIMGYGGTLSGGAANLQVVSSNPRYTYSLVNPATTPNQIQVTVSGVPSPLVWKGGKSPGPNIWNHTVTNFFNTGTSAYDRFYDGDLLTFDDTAATNLVNVTEVNAPGLLTFANNSLAYTLTGTGNLSGTLDKEGTGAVTLAISNTLALNSIINNQGTLILSPAVDSTLSTTISDNGSGLGALVKGGTNILTLSGVNSSYAGTTVVTNGVLRYAALTALGSRNIVYATNTGTLDINNIDTGGEYLEIAGPGFNGQGALADLTTTWPAWPYQIVHNITMTGDAAIGANNRWDLGPSGNSSLTGNGFNLTKVLGGQITLTDAGGTGVGNVDVVGGNLTFQGTTDMGDPTKSVTVETNAALGFWAGANPYTKNNVTIINGTLTSGGSDNTLYSAMTLRPGTNYISTSVGLYIMGPVSGAGGFIKQGGGTLYLNGTNNTYGGPTVIGANSTVSLGTDTSLGNSSLIEIDGGSTLDASSPGTLNLGAGQTVVGNGTISASLVNFNNGSTLAAGFSGATYTLTINGNLTFSAGSTNSVDVNKTTTVANDQVVGLGAVTMAGTLVISNIGSALAAGDSIQLFAATSYVGTFANIIPATPGAGLAWSTSTLSTGKLSVVSGVSLTPTNLVTHVSGNQLTLSWPADHIGWRLQAQTNTAHAGLGTNWVDVAGSSAVDQVIVPINSTNGSVFYRMAY